MSIEKKTVLEENVEDAQKLYDDKRKEYVKVAADEHEEAHARLFLGKQENALKEFRVSGTKVWLDIETTGLSEIDDDILQVGVVITDDDLNIIAEEEWLVPGDLTKCNDFVTNMHTHSGLFHALAMEFVEEGIELDREEALSKTEDIAEYIYRFITKHCPLDDKGKGAPVFCNNNVQFDDAFLRFHMPRVLEAMHYRRIDVSTLRRVYRDESKGAVDPGKPKCPHTALGDARVCLQEYKDLNTAYKAWVIADYLRRQGQSNLLDQSLAGLY